MYRVIDASDQHTIIQGDILEVVRDLPGTSIQLIVTSPPYFRLRSYGIAPTDWPEIEYSPLPGLPPIRIPAWRGCLGEEDDPLAYVGHLIHVFRQLKPLLRDDGLVFLNIGDTYAAKRSYQVPDSKYKDVGNHFRMDVPSGLKPKDLIFIPARVFLAMQADGWYGRSDTVWYRENAMPEGGVYDRFIRSHEYILMFSKTQKGYFFDWYHVLDKGKWERWGDQVNVKRAGKAEWIPNRSKEELTQRIFKLRRDVLQINTEPYHGGHSAAFPRRLVEILILAGSSLKACEICGAPWKPDIANLNAGRSVQEQDWVSDAQERGIVSGGGRGGRKLVGANLKSDREKQPEYRFRGWIPTCKCPNNTGSSSSLVLDPFMGSGTTLEVGLRLGRRVIGVDLSADFCEMAVERITQSKYVPSINYAGSVLKEVGDATPDEM